MKSGLISLPAYIVLAIIHLAAILAGEQAGWLVTVTKPLLLLMLILVFYFHSADSQGSFRQLVLAALIFSWLGDILLIFQQQHANFFLAGLVSFLVAHVCYIFAFRKTTVHHAQTLLKEKPWIILLFIMYGVGFFMLIRDGLGEMLLPVMFYMVVILIMSLMALNRFRRVEYHSFLLVLYGSLCFIASDSLLAINKFYSAFPLAGFLIMLTYTAAQFLIVKGTLHQISSERLKN